MISLSYDISYPLGEFLYIFRQIYKFCFDFMRQIEFFGTNLFNFTITVFLLIIVIPILFTLVRSEAVHNQNLRERVNKNRSRRKED